MPHRRIHLTTQARSRTLNRALYLSCEYSRAHRCGPLHRSVPLLSQHAPAPIHSCRRRISRKSTRVCAIRKAACLSAIAASCSRRTSTFWLTTAKRELTGPRGAFAGSELVDWLITSDLAPSRSEGVRVGQQMLMAGHITPVTDHGTPHGSTCRS